ncbi:MAG: nucleotide exchange factor GrpE [Bacteroidota bacterium]
MENQESLKEEEENTNTVSEEVVDETNSGEDQVQSEEESSNGESKEEVEEQTEEEKLAHELSEQKDKYLRLYSEFENFRRRSAKERLELINTASSGLMEGLLPVLDDMERALKAAESDKDNPIIEGLELIHQKFSKILKDKGLEEIEVGEGSEFDPEFQEAVTKIPAPSKKLKGKVVDVIEKGYKMGEKVIRYTKVVIGE